ncbi:MAG: hypothetical protein ACD_63C00211G0003 [uncultured bacterium]|nr:MAG: hypothetical protein ACD_63C00211G0003 [uncultured bacterium]
MFTFDKKEMNKREGADMNSGSFIWELIKVVIIALIIIIPVRFCVAQPFTVNGDSMKDNFHNKDYLIVDELSYRFKSVERGDVIVFKFPQNPKEFYIKRVIGLPLEIVKIEDGNVYICNNEYPDCFKLDESDYLSLYERTPGNKEIEAESGSYVVLGDNRNASSDSRSWGTLDKKYIVGKVVFRAWPFDDFGIIHGLTY